jgi:outer membrane protein
MKQLLLLKTILLFCVLCNAQTNNKWSLQQCVVYAQKNNVSVKQADVAARLSMLEVERTKAAIYPNANFSSTIGAQFGRSIDPTTNQYTNTQLLYNNLNLNASVQVYNWGALKINKQIAHFNALAAQTDVEKITNDIALNIATFYLQVLAANQQIEIAKVQLNQTQLQYKFTRLRVDAGSLPELNAAELEAQLARDSVQIINADANFNLAILQLKAAINLPMQQAFEVEMPATDNIFLEPLADLEPEALYKIAITNQPAQKSNNYTLQALQKNIALAKTANYPTISAFAGLGTNFANQGQAVTGYKVVGTKPTSAFVNIAGNNFFVNQPDVQFETSNRTFGEMWSGWGKQIDENFRQNIGIQLSVPIYNNLQAKLGQKRAILSYKNAEFVKDQINLNLQQNIYIAYNNAITALKRFNAGKKSIETAQIAFDFAKKRFEAGLGTSFDVITNQNNVTRAKQEQLNTQFDYIFRMKLLEFYKGQGLKF